MNDCYSFPTVPVAQGTEQLPSKQRVAGSNPAWDATTSKLIILDASHLSICHNSNGRTLFQNLSFDIGSAGSSKMKVIIRNPVRREIQITGQRRVDKLLEELNFNPEQVLVIRNNELLTRDIIVNEDDTVEILRAISGGIDEVQKV